jgi:hypothetical protein
MVLYVILSVLRIVIIMVSKLPQSVTLGISVQKDLDN